MSWNPNLSYGVSSDWFGNRDYVGNLKEIWDKYDPGKERQQKLMERRKDILSWMATDEGAAKIKHPNNRLGGLSTGLGSRIASDDYTKWFMGLNVENKNPDGTLVSDATKDYFGRGDLMHARATGRSWTEISEHLDKNPSWLRNENVKGGGGLYDDVKTRANFEKQGGEVIDELKEGLSGVSDTIKDEMGGVSGAIDRQTAAADKYRADQTNWQRRQENMQQMMIQEGRRKASERPVMAVMPGQGAYGGGAGGASAFARKKKQTTGLNIA